MEFLFSAMLDPARIVAWVDKNPVVIARQPDDRHGQYQYQQEVDQFC
jgi:hypothetical protein